MNYDKNSFLAGISVGRTLKGWAGGNNGFGGGGVGLPITIKQSISSNIQVGMYTINFPSTFLPVSDFNQVGG